MNQLEPLSATMRPYCFIAAAMTCAGPVIPEMSYAAPSRSRRPIGGGAAPEVSPAQGDAAGRKPARRAVELGVPVVNLFSGCPGDGPNATAPNWVTCAWPPDYQRVLEW